MNILASRFPGLQQSLPFLPLTNLPTPLDPAPGLAGHIGLEKLWIKRDDLSADVYGGNKVRKLEYLIADAIQTGSDALITFGAIGSNHALATSIFAQRQGLTCYAVLIDQSLTPYLGPTLRYHARIGTVLIYADTFKQAIKAGESAVANHPGGADRVYYVPWGGSSWLGTVGFINAALELADQFGADDAPEKIYLACGTWGTAAGLAIGLRLAKLPSQLVAVRVVPGSANGQDRFISLFEETNRELHEECLEAVELMSATERLQLDTTYTGKALAALLHDARETKTAGRRALFWNTYNGRPYPDDLDTIRPEAIPEPFRRYL
jgi:D-cysteine desulfhydrase